jgi:hypothetical protein
MHNFAIQRLVVLGKSNVVLGSITINQSQTQLQVKKVIHVNVAGTILRGILQVTEFEVYL